MNKFAEFVKRFSLPKPSLHILSFCVFGIFFFHGKAHCESQDKTSDFFKENPSVFWAWYGSALTPDQICVNPNPQSTTKLTVSTPVQNNVAKTYLIYPEKKPVKVKITLMEDGCKVFRTYGYCLQGKNHGIGNSTTSSVLNCKNWNYVNQDEPFSGSSGDYRDCDLNFPGEIYDIYIHYFETTSGNKPCKYEIKFEYKGETIMRKGIKIILIIALFPIAGITSQPFTERPVTPDKDKPFSDQISFCNTSSQYNDLTRATFYGDSRMDYAFQNPADMDFFLGASGQGWNVQNFGSSGETSEGLLTHLKSCLKYSNGQQYYQTTKFTRTLCIISEETILVCPMFLACCLN